jgi:hypothetical protein
MRWLALRSEADVRHDRDARGDDPADLLRTADAALELHRVRVGLLHEPERGVQGFVGAGLVGAERHVRHHECAADRAGDGAGEGDEVVHGDGEGRVVPEDIVAGRVADKQEVDAGRVEDGCRQLVVAREPGDLHAVFFGALEVPRANALEVGLDCRCAGVGHGSHLSLGVVMVADQVELGR